MVSSLELPGSPVPNSPSPFRERSTQGWHTARAPGPELELLFQISTSYIKVDKVQIIGSSSCPFAVCLDQDERKILQSVVR